MTNNSSRDQKVAKAAKKASLLAANQYFNQKQQQSETSQDTEEKSDPKTSETPQEIPNQKSRRQKALQWGKKASLFAASEYLGRNHQQTSTKNEPKKLTPMETFLEILQTAAFGISTLGAILLFLLIRFGLGQY